MKSILDRFSERMAAINPTAEKEYWDLGEVEIFGPDYNEGRWIVKVADEDEPYSEELSSKEEVSRYLKEKFGLDWNADGSYFPEIRDRHGDKPSFFRHIQDADMENVENPAKYHSDFLDYKRYSN